MSPELQKELAAWLASIRDTVQQGASFGIEQAPLLVQEKILYGRITSVLMLTVVVVALVVCARWLRRSLAEDDAEGQVVCACFGCGVFGFLLFPAGDIAVTAWFAPRLYVVEWLAGLLA